MAIYVNGQLVAPELIAEESSRHSANPTFRNIQSGESREEALRQAAERTAIERVLLTHLAAADSRVIDIDEVETEVKRHKESAGCRAAFNDGHLRFEIERRLRIQRLLDEMTADAPAVNEDDVVRYYSDNQSQFVVPALFGSAQIICQVNERQSEEQAYASISAALAALNSGIAFADVAENYSDCKGNGGLLPTYPGGEMVEDYEGAVHRLEPGERTGIFDTPFGFALHSR